MRRVLSSIWYALLALVSRLWPRRVPVRMQLTAVECGAACLAMVLNYFGRDTSVSECRKRCGIGRDGVTAQALARAARSYGLRVKAYSAEPQSLEHLPLPAIAHWNFNHFVVIERWHPKGVVIVDPASGRRTVSPNEFDRSFTGVVLSMEPGVHFDRAPKNARPPSWRTYLAQLVKVPGVTGLLVQAIGASLLLQVLGLALPIVTKVLVDEVLPFQMTSLMGILGIGIVLLVLAQLVTTYLRAGLLIFLQGRLDSQIMLGFFEHVLSLPFSFFQTRASGDLLMRLSSNTVMRELLTSQSISVILDGGLVFFYLAILLWQAPVFGLAVLGIGLVQVALLLGSTRAVHHLLERELATQAESQSYIVEALKGIATLKACGAEDRSLEHWSDLFYKHLNVSLERSHLSAVITTAMTTLRTFSPLFLLWLGALYVLNGTMSLGTMLALNALATSFLTPLGSLVGTGQQLQLVGAHLDRIMDVLATEPEQTRATAQEAPTLTGRIELEAVRFRYDPNSPLVLRDISVAIEPGQKVALVGRTGSGKSTLAMLLLGLYHPTQGTIRYDGIPLQRLNYQSLRRQVGVVLQDPFLFNSSIRNNITFYAPDISLAQVVEAARSAAVHEEITRMPMGYETLVAEGGAGLSGGQRQRLALARALAHQPVMLLLDEATSHLDVTVEREVDDNLKSPLMYADRDRPSA